MARKVYLGDMDALAIVGVVACMAGMCAVGMWLMVRMGRKDRDRD